MFHDPQQDVKAAKASVMLMCGKTQDANLHPRGNSKVLMISSAICAWLKAFDKSVWTHCMILYVVQNYYPTFKNETSKTAKCWDISGDLQRLTNTSSSFTLIFATLSVIQSFITPRPWIHELSLAPLLLTSKFEKFQYQGCLFRTSLSQQPPLESLSDSNFQHKKNLGVSHLFQGFTKPHISLEASLRNLPTKPSDINDLEVIKASNLNGGTIEAGDQQKTEEKWTSRGPPEWDHGEILRGFTPDFSKTQNASNEKPDERCIFLRPTCSSALFHKIV